MKRPLIIVFVAICAIWLLLLPFLVGLYLRAAVPEWTAGWPEPEAVEFESGWFYSTLNWTSSDGIARALRARHVPPLRPGLLRSEGSVDAPATPAPARIRSHFGLTGGWNLQTVSDRIEDPGALALEARGLALNLARPAGQPLTLSLSAEQLAQGQFSDTGVLGPVRLLARQHEDDQGGRHLGMELTLASEELDEATLTVSAGPAEPEALAELIEGLVQWAGSEPDSLTQRLALLTVIGAWQQLADGGLVVRVERLELGDQTQLSARWAARDTQPVVEGGGNAEDVAAWYAKIATLAGQPPDRSELVIEAWLMTLAQNGWIRLDDGRFQFTQPGAAEDVEAP